MTRFCLIAASVPLLVAAGLVRIDASELPRVPDGYTVEVVADAPLVKHPLMGCFDERGRLFIAESAGTNRRAQELIDEPLDFIRVLEDTDKDGTYDKSTIFADKLTFPQGVLCLDGAVYTCAPPHVWKLEDTDDDGVCDKRTVLVDSFGFNGNAASIHGPFLGPDGRLYWCDGRHGHEFFDETGELVSKGKAARIFSCNPDGSDVRTFAGGGMDNPVEVDWLDTGEMIGTVNLFYGRPRGDVLVHWVEGGVYPRFDQQDCIDEFTWTGGLLPEIHNYGHVAVSGMCRQRTSTPAAQSSRDADGAEPVASFLVTLFNTHKVVRTTLARSGSTFEAIAHEDLIVWDNPDVHPTDVLEAPDGSILVIDTGGWFRIGCPTSQIAKPEIPGAIYRVRPPTSAADEQRPALANDSLGPRPNPPGPNELRIIVATDTPQQRLAAIQSLSHKLALADSTAAGARVPDEAGRLLVSSIVSGLGRVDADAHLAHAVTYALIRLAAPEATRQALSHESPAVRRAALIALDQMRGGNLTEADVVPLLETDDPALLQAVLDVIGRHEGWVAATVPMFRQWLAAESPTEQQLASMRTFLLAQAADPIVHKLVSNALTKPETQPEIRQALIDVIAKADLDPLPASWVEGLRIPLQQTTDPETRLAAMRAIGSREIDAHDEELAEMSQHPDESSAARIEAFAAMASRQRTIPDEFLSFALEQLTGDVDLIEKLTLARGISASTLSEAQLTTLAGSFDDIGPAVVPVLLPAFEKSDDAAVGHGLVVGLKLLGDALSISPQELARLLDRYPESIRVQADALIASLGLDLEAQTARLEELLDVTAEDGDVSRGKAVFFGRSAGCSVCHQVGGEGGEVGPALTNIGAIRQPRDLLEAIAFPSASFAREYRPYTVLTDSGHVVSGIITTRTSDTVTLRTTDLKEMRIPRDAIEVMRQSDTSIMPKGLDAKLTPEELRDLVSYLQALK